MYRVLIVDDDVAVRYMLRRYKGWEPLGFVLGGEASDGREALRKLDKDSYDVVISDIKMPGMDGIEFLSELRNNGNDICVLFLSTHSDFSYAKQGIRLGVFDYLTKPFNDETLSEALERVKVYLDEKKKQKAIREYTKNSLKNSQAYYSKNDSKKLVSEIMSGSLSAVNLGEQLFEKITKFTEGDLGKLAILVENILMEVDEGIYNALPWIKNLENRPSNESFDGKDEKELKELFIGHISNWVRLVVKFELHQSDSLMRKICEFVINHVEEDIKIETIANELYVSRDYIGKLFKQKAGYNLSEYITKVKMEHAKYLISKGQYKNYEICERLGYKKADYFSQLFKSYVGCTPSEYRKVASKNI
ncbi:response regulator [Acetivibrio clariflavus]|uniref:response regulator transcription factor n=1 Tax=Acetivibrio clariflavus TaxID=288965 RepID=UPI0031F540DC